MSLPNEIKNSWWEGLTKRMMQVASSQNGYAIVKISILVDKDGNPVLWGEPKVTKVEPRGRSVAFLSAILNDL